ncbi:CaiB/BaiF CoA transferase family protein [Chloroflexota bacterium]
MKDALDLKVVQFSWVIAGPFIVKYLADHGATVVKVESPRRPELARQVTPFKDDQPGPDRAGYFAHWNANRYSMSLDLDNPEAIEVAKKLVAWGDIVSENFSPGMMERWGLGYEDLKKIKPDIIMVRSSAQGQTGPRGHFRALGIALSSLAGLTYFTGWPDQPPLAPPHAHSDVLSPRLGAVALLAALDYRQRTGKGQCIDISMLETTIPFLAPFILDYTANKREGERVGNSCSYASPHGIYRCQGDDRWCAIAVSNDQEWNAFCGVLGNPPWTKELKFATLLGRKQNEEALNRLVEEWSTRFTAEEVMTAMQTAGVAAGVVTNSKDVCEDPQLKERQHFWNLKHPVLGEFPHLGQPFKLSKTPAKGRMPSPCLGEHTEYVATKFLGMSHEEFVDLSNSGVFGSLDNFDKKSETA